MKTVPATGPTPSDLLIFGQCPGRTEVIVGEPLVGRSGRELDRFFTGDGLPERASIRLANIVPHRPAVGEAPSTEEIEAALPGVAEEITRTEPTVIVTLGAVAAKVFLGVDFTLDRGHGVAHRVRMSPVWSHPTTWEYGDTQSLIVYTVFPCYHPAAALHAPGLQSHLAADMEGLAHGLRHGFELFTSDKVETRYRLLARDDKIPTAFSLDTEGWPDEPWCVTISWEPGAAYLIRSADAIPLDQLRAALRQATRVTCHSLLADLDVLAAMDLHIPEAALDDTMIMAYLLALEPQGLKDLAYRWLGAQQETYGEVTRAATEELVEGYVTCLAASHENPRVVRACRQVLKKIADPENPTTAAVLWGRSKFSTVVDPVPRVTLDLVEPARALTYACRDADLTERLRPKLWARIKRQKLVEVYRSDLGVLPIVNRMQHVGMQIDRDHFEGLIAPWTKEYGETLDAITALVGTEINPNSGPQVSQLLFGQLGLPKTRYTKSKLHYTTKDAHLEARRDLHPVVPLILEAREQTNVRGFLSAVLEYARQREDETWALFPHLRTTRVITGRVSAFDPNVLGIPKHSARGKRIREGFIAGEGRVLLSHYLSQIELRVLAHVSQDPGMLAVYREGGDLHADLAERLFGVKPADQDPDRHRLPAKTVNFMMIMGATATGLQTALGEQHLEWSLDECQQFLDELWKVRPAVKTWIELQHAEARRLGYVRDFRGRRRYMAGVHSIDKWIRLEAEREAQATPIQSGAQEVFKEWMAAVWTDVLGLKGSQHFWYLEPCLQVHDDLIVEVSTEHAGTVQRRIEAALPQVLSVPVVTSHSQGERWSDL